jgi:hypothetical protein
MMVASIAIPATIFSYVSWVAYHDAFDHADEQLVATMHVMSEQAISVFQSVDLTFTSVDAILGDLSDGEIKASERLFAQRDRTSGPARSRYRADLQAADRGCGGAENPPGTRRWLRDDGFLRRQGVGIGMGSGRNPCKRTPGRRKRNAAIAKAKA